MAYNSDSNTAVKQEPADHDDIVKVAQTLSPIGDLNPANRQALSRSATVMHLQRNDQLKLDTVMRGLVYVVDGSVTLYNGKHEITTIEGGSKESAQPLVVDQAANQSIRTKAFAKLIRFSREQMDILLKEQERAATRVIERQVSEADNLVFDDIVNDMRNNSVMLGSFRETAKMIMAAIKARSMEIPELATIIQSDPGLAAHVILAASRADGANSDPVQTIRGAITRLGVEATVRMAMALPAKHALNSDNPVINAHLLKYSRRSTLASSITSVLATKVPGLKPDMALLAGLTADIGELLVLCYADRHPETFNNTRTLTETVENLRTICGSWLLGTWGFAPEFVETTHTARDWYRNKTGDIEYADLVTAALLMIQAEFPDNESSSIPAATNLLITRRLQNAGINILEPREYMQQAGKRITDLAGLLKSA
ncbi:HDOD domain-containing protein [Granulosicoccaceae sp. 1_MG-2023]|nr:HDOD domain-containing protein [Granulosicoccaceae sp. 1_MG-2023]